VNERGMSQRYWQLAPLLHCVTQPPPLGRVVPDASSMKAFNALKKGDSAQPDDISSFCRSINGGIVVAAVRDRSQLSAIVTTAMRNAQDCMYANLSE
jgi:hypothetical protein